MIKIRFIKSKNFNSLFKKIMINLEEKLKNTTENDEKSNYYILTNSL